MKINKHGWIFYFLVIILVILSVLFGYILKNDDFTSILVSMETGMNYEDNISCNNTNDLLFDSQCLRHDFVKFFNYNSSNNKIINISDFKINGGVCWHSALWYNDNLQKLGYKSKEIIIDGDNISHQFTIGWDDNITRICVFDQGVVQCW